MPSEAAVFERPPTRCYAPWNLVLHEGKLRLAYLTRLYGGGPIPGPAMGGKGHLVSDSGEFTEESRAEVSFRQGAMFKEWRNRPRAQQVEIARALHSL